MMSIKRALRFHLVRMVSAKKTKDYVVKRVRVGRSPCGSEHKLVLPLWRLVWRPFTKLKAELLHDLAIWSL